jgi:hypothetical protein
MTSVTGAFSMTVVEKRPIELNFDELREKGFIWIRRASVFMSIGSNAAAIPLADHAGLIALADW